MDIATHAILGATIACAFAGGDSRARIAAVGATAACVPDLDVLIRDPQDPLLTLEYHRHFSHSLLLSIPIALLVGLVWKLVFRARLHVVRCVVAAFLGCLSAVLLDACTSYGTKLLWPFADDRIALSIISIVDPVFTGVLVLFLTLALLRRMSKIAGIGVVLAGVYLATGYWQQQRVQSALVSYTNDAAQPYTHTLTRPSFGNIILWRGLAWNNEQITALALRAPFFGDVRIYPGETLPRPTSKELQAWTQGSESQGWDIERFAALADGLLLLHPSRPSMIGDARYALLPNSLEPLWGIEARSDKEHVAYVVHRRMTPKRRDEFTDMLLGK